MTRSFHRKLKRTVRCFVQKVSVLILIFSLLLSQFSFFIPTVHAASSPWTQTDWVGGSGQATWSDTTKYDSASAVTTSTAGQATLTNTEELSNTGFESDLTSWTEVPSYTLNDQFTTNLSAGSVNGTSAEPTGGTRTVVDTNSKLSITGNQLSFATGGVGYGNPGLWYPSLSRSLGKLLVAKINKTSERILVGFDTDQTSLPATNAFFFMDGSQLLIYDNNSVQLNVGSSASSTDYLVSVVLRSSGAYYFIKGGNFTNWTLVHVSALNSTATLYPTILASNLGVAIADNIRIPTATWLPIPLAYDTFTRSDGAIGSSETTGPDSQTTPSLTWTGGAISSNKNVITPTLGSEVLTNSGLETPYTGGLANGWTKEGTPTVSEENTIVHGGSSSQQIYKF